MSIPRELGHGMVRDHDGIEGVAVSADDRGIQESH